MSEAQSNPITWESVISDFLEDMISQSPMFKARQFIEKKDKEIASEKDEIKKAKMKKARDTKEADLETLRKNASGEFNAWFDKQINGKTFSSYRIKKATHPLKFVHGSSEAEGIFLLANCEDRLVTTDSLKKDLIVDMAHNNGAAITISRFLSLSRQNEMIIDLILTDDFEFLKPFSKNDEQLEIWKGALESLVCNGEIKTADKAKQVYFPINNISEYHLLTPMFSSSIAEEIYQSQIKIKYSEKSKAIRKAMHGNEGSIKYCSGIFVTYPNLAVQKFGGAQPQNVSMLNKGRRGITYLINSAPPVWQSQPKPPVYQKTFFDTKLRRHIPKDDIDYLRGFLIRFDRIELSIKHPKRKQWINDWVGRIIDAVLDHAAYIQSMEPGWAATEAIRLKKEHRLFLDPYNKDENFQAERKQNAWQAVVCTDFARWLNSVLTDTDHKFSPQREHTRIWLELMETALREFDELVSMDIKAVKVKA